MKKFMQKLWKEESGASHIVEIIVVIVVVIALAAVLLGRLKTSIGKSADELDKYLENPKTTSITVETPYVI